MSVNEEIEKIISEQGWSDETRLCYYEEFVEKMELENKFLEFIKEIDESQAGGFQK